MGQVPDIVLPEGLRDLQMLLESEWPARRAALHASGVPLCEDDPDPDPDPKDPDPDPKDPDPDPDASKTFDAAYVKKIRDEAAKYRREAREAQARAKEYEDQNKTEAQKLEERATAAEQKAAAAEGASLRLEVALDKAPEGMSIAQVRKLAKRLTGSTKEELEADAEELFSDFAPNNDDDGRAPSGRPRERLRPGATTGNEPDEDDPRKLAAMVPRRYR